jgi:hypothetical protein
VGGLSGAAAATQMLVMAFGGHTASGQTRLDLAHANLAICEELAGHVKVGGLPRVSLVATSPLDVLTEYLTRRWAGRMVDVIGSGTSLDTWRLRGELSSICRVMSESLMFFVRCSAPRSASSDSSFASRLLVRQVGLFRPFDKAIARSKQRKFGNSSNAAHSSARLPSPMRLQLMNGTVRSLPTGDRPLRCPGRLRQGSFEVGQEEHEHRNAEEQSQRGQ